MATSKSTTKKRKPAKTQKEQTIHHPHDKLFFASLRNKSIAQDAIEIYLPEKIVQKLDFLRMKLYKTKLVSAQWKEFEADIFYEIPLDQGEALLLFHCEHITQLEPTLPLKVWQYVLLALLEYAENHPGKPLPIPFILVIYTGEPTCKRVTLFDLFGEHKQMAKEALLEGPPIVDVCRLADDDIRKHRLFGLAELAFKYKKSHHFEKYLRLALPKIKEVAVEVGDQYTYIYMSYVAHEFPSADYETFKRLTEEELPEVMRQEAMTIAQQLEQRGFKQGIEQGIHRIHQIAVKLLEQGFSLSDVIALTGLSEEAVKKLESQQR